MSVSANVVVMTGEEYAASGDAAFKRGVERGKLEASGTRSRPTFYCYAPQRMAVESFLAPYMKVRPVDDANLMRGISRGTFAHVTCHPDQVPADVWMTISKDGWMVLTIDDYYARGHALRMRQ